MESLNGTMPQCNGGFAGICRHLQMRRIIGFARFARCYNENMIVASYSLLCFILLFYCSPFVGKSLGGSMDEGKYSWSIFWPMYTQLSSIGKVC